MTHFILLDAGLGNFVFLIVGPALIGFVLGGIYLIARSIRIIRRELKNEERKKYEDTTQE